jgi:hypothetical protein
MRDVRYSAGEINRYTYFEPMKIRDRTQCKFSRIYKLHIHMVYLSIINAGLVNKQLWHSHYIWTVENASAYIIPEDTVTVV